MSNKPYTQSMLRIIAGKWRGRKLAILDAEGLRPTPDRVRETLFNWLQYDIANTRCLDLFSGSGALGFEAASRGASAVSLIESQSQIVKKLQENKQLLSATHCDVVHNTAQQFLTTNQQQYDIIFIDPPYQANYWQAIGEQIMLQNTLADHAYIYLECPCKGGIPSLPIEWQKIKDKKAGDVHYCLFEFQRK